MRIDNLTIEAARSLSDNDAVIKKLLDFYDFVTKNSAYETYVSRMVTLDNWNENLINSKINIITPEAIIDDERKAEDDAKKRDKDVDRVLKLLSLQLSLLQDTEAIRAKLTGVELEKLSKDKRASAIQPLAL